MSDIDSIPVVGMANCDSDISQVRRNHLKFKFQNNCIFKCFDVIPYATQLQQ